MAVGLMAEGAVFPSSSQEPVAASNQRPAWTKPEDGSEGGAASPSTNSSCAALGNTVAAAVAEAEAAGMLPVVTRMRRRGCQRKADS